MRKVRPIHERVRTHVERAGITITELARLTGWHELRAGRVLRGTTRLLATDMETLADVLGRSIASLYRDVA